MERRDLIDLFYTAYDRFHTVQMNWQYRYDVPSMNRVQERWAAQFPPGSVGILSSGLSVDSDQSDEVRVYRKVWWRKPACWRADQQMDGHGNSVTVHCDGAWWVSFSSGVICTNDVRIERSRRGVQHGHPPALDDLVRDVPLLDPAFLLATHKLEFVGETIHADRPALRVRATYLKAQNRLYEGFFWASADAYDLLVDKEYGILLRYAALLDGREFAVTSVDQIRIDEPIPDDVFAFPSVS